PRWRASLLVRAPPPRRPRTSGRAGTRPAASPTRRRRSRARARSRRGTPGCARARTGPPGAPGAGRASAERTRSRGVARRRTGRRGRATAGSPSARLVARRAPARRMRAMARVLVADDEENIRLVLETLLRRHGYEVKAVPSAEQALAALEGFAPDF